MDAMHAAPAVVRYLLVVVPHPSSRCDPPVRAITERHKSLLGTANIRDRSLGKNTPSISGNAGRFLLPALRMSWLNPSDEWNRGLKRKAVFSAA